MRTMPPTERHSSILARFDGLLPGDGFVLVNDHDPKPLYYQFDAEMPGQFSWQCLESGPGEWKVLIGKTR